MTLPSPAALFASIAFGIVGMVAFRHGKRYGLWQPLVIGIALMVYPYFIDQTWLLYGIGCALCGALYFLREG
jgi:drug/metabolite transporter (DMT)-like permease